MSNGRAVYNEVDEYAAQWLRNLVSAGHIAPGDVDTRSIVDVGADDYRDYTQVHLFAGIGGWSLAARLAGWPDDKPLWTGSCPCQPFSAAGKRKGAADERHLWPEMRRLVAALRPDVVAGEQVASKDGRVWLSGVRADLEAMAYASWSVDACSAGVGAPHIRQRIWWLGVANSDGFGARLPTASAVGQRGAAVSAGHVCGVANTDGGLAGDGGVQRGGEHGQQPQDSRAGGVEHAASDGRVERRAEPGGRGTVGGCGVDQPVNAEHARLEGHAGHGHNSGQSGWLDANTVGPITAAGDPSFWSTYSVVHCTDGKARRFEPGSFPLAHGVSNRVGRLRAYGNAINPWLAAEVLGAYLGTERLRLNGGFFA